MIFQCRVCGKERLLPTAIRLLPVEDVNSFIAQFPLCNACEIAGRIWAAGQAYQEKLAAQRENFPP